MSAVQPIQTTDTEGKPSVVIYEAQSGVIFHITPLNLATMRAIQLKAADLLPYPDKSLYRFPEENGFADGQLTAAEDNPDYIIACQEKDHERAQWSDRAIFNFATRTPKYPTRSDLIAAFRPQLDELREIAVLPEDDYEAVLLHLVLTWNQVGLNARQEMMPASSDYTRIIHLAIQTVALTPDEVTAGIRFFRPQVPERAPRKVAG